MKTKKESSNKRRANQSTLNLIVGDLTNSSAIVNDYISLIENQENSGHSDCTSSSTISDYGNSYFINLLNFDILIKNKKNIEKITNPDVRKKVIEILIAFQDVIIALEKKKSFADLVFPQIRIDINEDQSALIEWIFNNFRVGIAIEINDKESSWYLVSNREMNEFSQSGLLPTMPKIHMLINDIIQFVLKHG